MNKVRTKSKCRFFWISLRICIVSIYYNIISIFMKEIYKITQMYIRIINRSMWFKHTDTTPAILSHKMQKRNDKIIKYENNRKNLYDTAPHHYNSHCQRRVCVSSLHVLSAFIYFVCYSQTPSLYSFSLTSFGWRCVAIPASIYSVDVSFVIPICANTNKDLYYFFFAVFAESYRCCGKLQQCRYTKIELILLQISAKMVCA